MGLYLSKKIKIYSPKVSSKLVIYHDSDWHVGIDSDMKRMYQLQEEVERIQPDFRLISGDILDDAEARNTKNGKEVLNLLQRSEEVCPTIVSMGNHDNAHKVGKGELDWEYSFDPDWYRKIEEVTSSHLVKYNDIYEGNVWLDDQIEIVVMNPPYEHYFEKEEAKKDFLAYYQKKDLHFKTGKDHFHILVLHTPAVAPDLVQELPILKEADIVTSGHMHAGIVPPYVRPFMNVFKSHWGLRSPNNQLLWKANYCWGTISKDDTDFIVNPGVTKIGPEKIGILQILNKVLPNESYCIEVHPEEKQKVLSR